MHPSNDLRDSIGKMVELKTAPGSPSDKLQSLISDAKLPDAEKELAKETVEHNNEAFGNIPQDLREKITAKFHELRVKHPKMKRDRALRKAGEFYKVKFTFE